MILEHLAIWTNQLESLKEYYINFLEAIGNEKYTNVKNQFESYFLTFTSDARLELMQRTGIPENKNDIETMQHLGFIHLAFGVETMNEVDEKASEFKLARFKILKGPRKIRDGYYEFETLDADENRLEVTTPYKE